MNRNPELSIVIPVRDEAGSIPGLFQEIEQVIGSIGRPCELLFIDDHSIDDTVEIVQKLAPNAIGRVRCISLDHKQGKDWALERGFREAQGSIIITLDGDGQNDPADIPGMLEALKDNDMVCGIRHKRQDPVLKQIGSAIANKVRIFITNDPIIDAGCALRVIRKRCAEYLYPLISAFSGTAHYFFPTLLKMHGKKVIQVPVQHRKRLQGRSKFKVFRRRVINGLKGCFCVRRLSWRVR